MRGWCFILFALGCGGETPQPAGAFEKLSDYQLFTASGGKLTYSAGVVPYDLNTPLFSDYALKFRAVKLPAGKKATYDPTAVFQFPVGTIVVKTFAFPADQRDPQTGVKLIETRLLIREADGWTGLPYLWNDAQTEATLSPAGAMPNIDFLDFSGAAKTAHYLVPTEGQCKQCHVESGTFELIGPKARNLNRDFDYGGSVENQLAHWVSAGILEGAPDPASAPRLPVWSDPTTGTVEERARAWLDGNCAHCHNPKGLARTTGLFLGVAETNQNVFGVCKKPVAAGPGTGGFSYDIVPGAPDQSILVFRIDSTEPGLMMPQIGRSLIHEEGVALIREWITGMSGSCQ
jgi:uncharacterized repeat protein (TIGR03806 family)